MTPQSAASRAQALSRRRRSISPGRASSPTRVSLTPSSRKRQPKVRLIKKTMLRKSPDSPKKPDETQDTGSEATPETPQPTALQPTTQKKSPEPNTPNASKDDMRSVGRLMASPKEKRKASGRKSRKRSAPDVDGEPSPARAVRNPSNAAPLRRAKKARIVATSQPQVDLENPQPNGKIHGASPDTLNGTSGKREQSRRSAKRKRPEHEEKEFRNVDSLSANDLELKARKSIPKAEDQNGLMPNRLSSTKLNVHHCSFLKPHVPGVTAVAASPSGLVIVIARADCNVEVLRKADDWTSSAIVYAKSGSRELTVSSLNFSICGRYVFVTRLDGSLTIFRECEDGLVEHVRLQPGGGAIWDLAVSPNSKEGSFTVAAACDDGCVRFVSPDPAYLELCNELNGMVFSSDPTHYIVRSTQKTSARILSVAWAPNAGTEGSSCVVSGDSEGGLQWFNVRDGSCYGKGRIPKLRKTPVMIWTLQVVQGGSFVVSGDDRGIATVWSSTSFTIGKEFKIENLAGSLWCSALLMAGSSTETVLFGSANGGVGGLRTTKLGETCHTIRGVLFHTHDVRGIAALPFGQFAMGSLDCCISLSRVTGILGASKKRIQVLPTHFYLRQQAVQFCKEHQLAVVRSAKHVELWSFMPGGSPRHRLNLHLSSSSSGIRSCAISDTATLVALSTPDSFKLYNIWDGQGSIGSSSSFAKVEPLQVPTTIQEALSGCTYMTFNNDNLFAVSRCRTRLHIYNWCSGTISVCGLPETQQNAKYITNLACGGKRIAIGDSRGRVHCTTLTAEDGDKTDWKTLTTSEDSSGLISALSVSSCGEFVATSGRSTGVLIHHFTSSDQIGRTVLDSGGMVVTSICFGNSSSLLFSGSKFIRVANLTGKFSSGKGVGKNSKNSRQSVVIRRANGTLWCSAVLGSSAIAAVYFNQEVFQSSLPSAIPKKSFGA